MAFSFVYVYTRTHTHTMSTLVLHVCISFQSPAYEPLEGRAIRKDWLIPKVLHGDV